MLTISREADYAVRIMVHMASSTRDRHQAKTLAREQHIPESFLSKILQMLIKQRVVRSFRGVGGGYQLAVDPARLSLYRLVEMVEGPVGLNACVMSGIACDLVAECAPHDIWVVAQAQLRKTLEAVTIADLAQSASQKRSRITSIDSVAAG
jgi:Rrf2 family iron-sulfur cluster assembly transcriptional regulator